MPTWYESTLKPQLVTDADTVLDHWGETVTRRIAGDESDTESITAVVDLDDELAGGADGDSVQPDSPLGRRVSRTGVMEMTASQSVDAGDVYVLANGEVWSFVRVVARDDGMKSVFIRRVDGGTSKRARIRP